MRRFTIILRALLIAIGTNPLFFDQALGHDFTVTDTSVVFHEDGNYRISMQLDVDALALGVPPSLPSVHLATTLIGLPEDEFQRVAARTKDTLLRRVRIRFDGVKQMDVAVGFPEIDVDNALARDEPSVLGTIAEFSGRVPDGAEQFTFGASRSFNAVHLTIRDASSNKIVRYILGPSEDCPAYRLNDEFDPETASRLQIAIDYLVLGFEHIIPYGLDHILFVMGLFLLNAKLRPLLWQVTAFTLAHCTTLALSIFDVVSLPSEIVEPMIALSIAYVGIENAITTKLGPWRPALVFCFGLLHGLGFAGVLQELGLPRGDTVLGLLSFNVGVEFGQLAVIALMFLLVGWFTKRPWYRRWISAPLSLAIAGMGIYWFLVRTDLLN